MKRLFFILFALLVSSPALAQENAELSRDAYQAIQEKKPGEAIDKLELLADRGVVDPVISFQRGRAYAERVRMEHDEPGDLGRAIHGFEEARELTRSGPVFDSATRALEILRAEVARRRARSGDPVDIEDLSLSRSIVRLLSENVWAAFAIATSIAFALSLAIRARTKQARIKTAITTAAAIALPLTLLTAGLAYAARYDRTSMREGIVIGSNVKPADARHITMQSKSPLAEGARVRLLEAEEGYVHIHTGTLNAWVPEDKVLPLVKVGR